MVENLHCVDSSRNAHTMYHTRLQNNNDQSNSSLQFLSNSQSSSKNSTQQTHYAKSNDHINRAEGDIPYRPDFTTFIHNTPPEIVNYNNNSINTDRQANRGAKQRGRDCSENRVSNNVQQRRYYETLLYENIGIIKILPEDILLWYPGFNLPIGTTGRSMLRKDLHQQRLKCIANCDRALELHELRVTSRSTFGDMKIVDLYHSAYLLGIWNVAAHYCLNTCERKGYKKEWIFYLKESGYEINIKTLRMIKQSIAKGS